MILDYICGVARHQFIFYLWRPLLKDPKDDIHPSDTQRPQSYQWRPLLKDPKDDMVLELAVAAQCDWIVTFNKRDFVGAEQFGIQIATPREFLWTIGGLK